MQGNQNFCEKSKNNIYTKRILFLTNDKVTDFKTDIDKFTQYIIQGIKSNKIKEKYKERAEREISDLFEIKELLDDYDGTDSKKNNLIEESYYTLKKVMEEKKYKKWFKKKEKYIELMTNISPQEFYNKKIEENKYRKKVLKSVSKDKISKYDEFITKPKKKKNSHSGFIAPEGWAFQDRRNNLISIIQIKDGDWNLLWDIDNEIHEKCEIKGNYVYAELLDSNNAYSIDSRTKKEIKMKKQYFVRTNVPLKTYHYLGVENTVKELICIAECINSGIVTNDNLNTIRLKWNLIKQDGLPKKIYYDASFDNAVINFCDNTKTAEEIMQCRNLQKELKEKQKEDGFFEQNWDCHIGIDKNNKKIKVCSRLERGYHKLL